MATTILTALYLRASSRDQTEDIPAQRDLLTRYAADHGLEIGPSYEEAKLAKYERRLLECSTDMLHHPCRNLFRLFLRGRLDGGTGRRSDDLVDHHGDDNRNDNVDEPREDIGPQVAAHAKKFVQPMTAITAWGKSKSGCLTGSANVFTIPIPVAILTGYGNAAAYASLHRLVQFMPPLSNDLWIHSVCLLNHRAHDKEAPIDSREF